MRRQARGALAPHDLVEGRPEGRLVDAMRRVQGEPFSEGQLGEGESVDGEARDATTHWRGRGHKRVRRRAADAADAADASTVQRGRGGVTPQQVQLLLACHNGRRLGAGDAEEREERELGEDVLQERLQPHGKERVLRAARPHEDGAEPCDVVQANGELVVERRLAVVADQGRAGGEERVDCGRVGGAPTGQLHLTARIHL